MSQQRIACLRASLADGKVVLTSDDPKLQQGSDGTWTFTIAKDTAAQVVFEVQATDEVAVRSQLRRPDDSWDEWVEWGGTGPRRSPVFVHPQDFRLEVAVGGASGTPPVGGGFFQIREVGGGDF